LVLVDLVDILVVVVEQVVLYLLHRILLPQVDQ
jgi:hypothetical protein